MLHLRGEETRQPQAQRSAKIPLACCLDPPKLYFTLKSAMANVAIFMTSRSYHILVMTVL